MNKRVFHIQRPLVCAVLCFCLGIYIGWYWPQRVLWLPLIGLGFAIILTVSLVADKGSLIYGISFILLFTGLIYSNVIANPTLPPEGKYIVRARMSGLTQSSEDNRRIKALLVDIELIGQQGEKFTVGSAYWTYYSSPEFPLPIDGQHIEMESTLYHPMGRQNPYGFDFRMYLLQKGIHIGLSGAGNLQVVAGQANTAQNPWLKARIWLSNIYDEAMPIGSELIKALLWGDRSMLLDEVEQDFRDSGIAHVLSVSGLHVGILTVAILSFFVLLGIPAKIRFLLMAILLTLYCFLLSFNAPVFRAAFMSLVILAASVYHERSDPLTSLVLACMVILAFSPLDLFNAGFQLSFLAVLGIFTLGDRMQASYLKLRRERRSRQWQDKLVYAFQTTLAASVFTAPIVMSVFHRFSLIGLFFSPFACFAVAILMVYGLVLLPFAVMWMPLAKVLALPLAYFSYLFTRITNIVADLPLATMQTAAPGVLVIFSIFFMLILCTRYIKLSRKYRTILFSISLITILMLNLQWKTQDVTYTLFSSGNADAAVIEDDNCTYVIDTEEHGGDISSYLLSKGKAVDYLFISHLHHDHIGGLKRLVDQGVHIKELILSAHALQTKSADGSLEILQYALDRGIPLRFASQGDEFGKNRVNLKVLWPIEGKMYPDMDPNHNSMALLIDLNGVSLLTAGDLTEEYELYSAQPAQVLKLAHHGAKKSTSPEYLSAVSPQLALLSANHKRLPYASAVIERLTDRGISLWGTQEGQAIILTVKDNGNIQIEHYHDRGMR